MTKLFKIAIVSLAVIGSASTAQAAGSNFSVDTIIQDHSLNGG